ncbi:unnamed protein product [Absidia cylindrospora]
MTNWEQQEGSINDSPLVTNFLQSTSWTQYTPRSHRQRLLTSLPQVQPPPSLSPRLWHTFWQHPQHLYARTLWYRLLLGKLYCQRSLAHFRPSTTPLCLFCSESPEDLQHMFVTCTSKWTLWQLVCDRLLPGFSITPSTIVSCLFALDFSPNPHLSSTLWLLCGCVIQAIWRHHWAFVIHRIPFTPSLIFPFIASLFSQLRPPPHVYYIPHPLED